MGIMQLLEGEFFVESDPHADPQPGDIYWIPTPNIEREPRILQLNRAHAENHFEAEFEVVPVSEDHFHGSRRGEQDLPVKLLHLGPNAEAMISSAKKRPCVVLGSSCVGDVDTLPEPAAGRAAVLGQPTLLVAPLVSVAHPLGPGTFMPQLVARIRCLEYSQFFPLPDHTQAGGAEPKSIVRLDRLRSTHLYNACDRSDASVSEEVLALLRAQARMLAGGDEPENYRLTREIVAESLPTLEEQANWPPDP